MSKIIIMILFFIIGFCFGSLHETKHTLEVLKMAKKQNEEWALLCTKQNDDWSKYCESLIDKIKILKGSSNNEL